LLREPLDQSADVPPEQLIDLGPRGRGILDGVVQQRGRDGGVVELEVGEDRRDFERVGEIRIARGARLAAVRLHGVDVGAVEQRLVGIGIIAPDPFYQVILAHDPRFCRFSLVFRYLGRNRGRVLGAFFRPRAPARLILHPRQIGHCHDADPAPERCARTAVRRISWRSATAAST